MTGRTRRAGLRPLLGLLVLVALAPPAGLLVFGALQHRSDALREGEAQALRLARGIAAQQERVLRDTASILEVLSLLPALREGGPDETRPILADVLRNYPWLANVGVVGSDGVFLGSALAVPPGANAGDRSWFSRALARDGVVVGEFQIGKITGRPSINLARGLTPLGTPSRRVLFAAVDLSRLHDGVGDATVPEGTSVVLLDAGGAALMSRPSSILHSGERLRDGPVARAVLSGTEGAVPGEGADAVARVHGFVPLREEGSEAPVGFLAVGIPEAAILRTADAALWGGLLGMAIAAAAAVLGAFAFANVFLVRPLARLEGAAARLSAGDLSTRAGPPYDAGEIGCCQQALDSLAAALGSEKEGRRGAESSLERREEMFRQMAESIEEVFWVSEPGERPIKYASPAFERVWGFPPERLYEDSSRWSEAIHPSDRRRVADAVARDEEAGRYDETYRIVRPDGSVRWIRDRAFPVRGADGRIVRIFGIAEDMTRTRDLEHQVQHSQKMEAVGRLAAGVAHDFNNLLTVIQGYTELAIHSAEARQKTEHLEEVVRAAKQAALLTRQLLTFSRKQVVSPRSVDLNALLGEMGKMVQRLIGPGIEVVSIPGRNLRHIHADPMQLQQVVMNLVVNARDAMPDGGRLTVETYDVVVDEDYALGHLQARPGPYVVLAVSDTGIGMDEATRQRVFEPFFTTKEEGRGTGLGLATVYGIVKQCGGDVWVYSEPGKGSTFKIYFPPHDGGPASRPEASPAERPRHGPRTVLLVEDDRAIRALLYAALRADGHTVIACESAEEALRESSAFQGNVDLLLTDLGLPGMDGLSLAGRIREARPGIRVLLASGYTESTAAHRGGLPEWAEYIAKPFGPAEALRKVSEVLAREAPRDRGGPPAPRAGDVGAVDPAECRHGRVKRLGIQRSPVRPHRLHLVLCRVCGTTLTTERLQQIRETWAKDPDRRPERR